MCRKTQWGDDIQNYSRKSTEYSSLLEADPHRPTEAACISRQPDSLCNFRDRTTKKYDLLLFLLEEIFYQKLFSAIDIRIGSQFFRISSLCADLPKTVVVFFRKDRVHSHYSRKSWNTLLFRVNLWLIYWVCNVFPLLHGFELFSPFFWQNSEWIDVLFHIHDNLSSRSTVVCAKFIKFEVICMSLILARYGPLLGKKHH